MKSGKMKIWRNYLLLETKKGMRFIPFFAVSIAIIAGAVVLATSVFLAVMSSRGSLTRAQIGIVTTDRAITVTPGGNAAESTAESAAENSPETAPESGSAPKDTRPGAMTSLAVRLVSQMDSVKTLASFSFVKQKEAEAGLADGSLDAVIYISADTYDNINNGTNTPVLIRLGAGAAGLEKDLFASLVSAGVRIFRTVEGAVYAPMAAGQTYTLVTDPGTIGDRIFDLFLKTAMNREALWNKVSVSAFGSLTGSAFYLVSAVTAALFLFGVGFSSFYTSEERSVLRLLARSGPSVTALETARLLAVFFSCLVFGTFLLLGTDLASAAAAGSPLPEVLRAFPRSIPFLLAAAGLMASWIHLVNTFLPDQAAAFGMLLLVLLLFVVSGGLLPTAYLPDALRSVSSVSPVHLVQLLVSRILWPEASGSMNGALGWSAALSAALLIPAWIGGVRHD